MSDVVIGLDLGTSSCKAAIFDLAGTRLALARVPYPTDASGVGVVTQNATDWSAAAVSALATISGRARGRRILGIGLSAQIGTHVLLDEAGTPLHEAVTWQDGRSAGVLPEIGQLVDHAEMCEDLDTWLPPGAAWPLPRLLWFKQTFPDLVRRARWIAQPKDLVALALTGNIVSDASSWRGVARADGSLLLDTLATLELPDLFPPLISGFAEAGRLSSIAAAATGLPVGLPVFAGWNDLNSSLLGIGAVHYGFAFDVGGTSEHLGVLSSAPSSNPRVNSVPLHRTKPTTYSVYGVTSNAGSVVEWLHRSIDSRFNAEDGTLERAIQQVAPGSNGLLFLPYLSGERAPVWDALSSGAFIGLTHTHDAPALARAALEGVAFNLRQIRDSLPGAQSTSQIRATGGTSRMQEWNTIKADVFQTPISVMKETDSSVLGAAMTAAVGSGTFETPDAASGVMVHENGTTYPNPANAGRYDDLYASFLDIYPAIADISNNLKRKELNV